MKSLRCFCILLQTSHTCTTFFISKLKFPLMQTSRLLLNYVYFSRKQPVATLFWCYDRTPSFSHREEILASKKPDITCIICCHGNTTKSVNVCQHPSSIWIIFCTFSRAKHCGYGVCSLHANELIVITG